MELYFISNSQFFSDTTFHRPRLGICIVAATVKIYHEFRSTMIRGWPISLRGPGLFYNAIRAGLLSRKRSDSSPKTLLVDSFKSPNLGPPAVVPFDDSEPLAYNRARSSRKTSTELIEESERSVSTTPTSFENKRKRGTISLLNLSSVKEAVSRTEEEDDRSG